MIEVQKLERAKNELWYLFSWCSKSRDYLFAI
jgi:hypothetical protein